MYDVLPLLAMSISCSGESPENYVRLEILERLYTHIKPSAESLKQKVGSVIEGWAKPYLDAAPPLSGFPILSASGNCSFCNQISDCFNNDCEPLEILMRFVHSEVSSVYTTEIVTLTEDLSVVREQMGCEAIHICPPVDIVQEKDTGYRIAKDTVEFIDTLEQRYSTVY
ncbi:Hypothetical predicted protein [Mytilus galloprovincialis]|uniref:Uncharacterized protein n=1 Tax=Mytilus galloprovincialis TaxID=29158 RepID=A0A8B6H4D8_MYTGA|nr:Hypothetical predicted protein [Mytilus galloprovincialis]